MRKYFLAFIIPLLLWNTSIAQSTITWSGESDEQWFNTNNWIGNEIPNSDDSAIIPNGCSHYPSEFSQFVIDLEALFIDSNAKLILPEDNSVSISSQSPIVIMANDSSSGIFLHYYQYLNISYQQEFSGGLFHDTSSPISDGLSNIFTGSNFYFFDSSINNWEPIGSTSLPLTPGQGFFCYNEENMTYFFDGTSSSGPIVAPIEYVECRGNSFVGNPYTTPIDWDLISNFNRFDIDKSIYVWDEYEANYKTWNGVLGKANKGIIKPGKAFFVKVESVDAALIFTDDIKLDSYEKEVETPEGFLQISVSDGRYSDHTFLWWHEDGTENYDFELDAEKFFGYTYSPDLYTMGVDYNCGPDTLPYSINTLPLPITTFFDFDLFTQKLYFESGDSTDYSFDFNFNNLDDYITYFFIDSLLNVEEEIVDLFSYNFSCPANTLFDNRFFIKSDFDISIAENPQTIFNIYASNNGNLHIQNKYSDSYLVKIYDLLGHEIYTGEINSGNNKISITSKDQYLIVRIYHPKGPITQKIFVN